jgi:hypothetical protein
MIEKGKIVVFDLIIKEWIEAYKKVLCHLYFGMPFSFKIKKYNQSL